ncbi:MAG: PorT family protein [Candidatus Azobacteroides sp.]|nr:PorT family protein [Candidatus Azobacteroides sp.]
MIKLKSLLLTVFLLGAFTASAQLSFGLKAGLNLSDMSDYDNTKMKIGYKVGPTVNLSLGDIGFQGAILLSSKGVKGDGVDGKIDANYLEIPVSFVYKRPVAFDTNLYINAGPYFAYGLFGKTDLGLAGEIDTFSDEMLNRFDMGLTFGVGIEVLMFNFGVNYDLGLTKIDDFSNAKNRNLWISVGYNF